MEGSWVTPAKGKKRMRSDALNQRGMMGMFESTEHADLAYINLCLQNKPTLIPYLASLLRDGSMERALTSKLLGPLPESLGKALSFRCKRMRNLPPRFWVLLWGRVCPDVVRDSVENLTALQHMHLAEFALEMAPDVALPTLHKSSGYEGPLLAVFMARLQDKGDRIKNITRDQVDSMKYGYFHFNPETKELKYMSGEIMNPGITEEQWSRAADWCLTSNHNLDAALASDSLGHVTKLFKLAANQGVQNLPCSHAQEFEHSDAANDFPHAPGSGGSASGSQPLPAASANEAHRNPLPALPALMPLPGA
mmetsp:Transcript_111630/g.240657  ORF Transcript_111630/g.240657 Transcript_111630/m.240657 type:complete len:308 (+) Transcript_111630:55-978(+)